MPEWILELLPDAYQPDGFRPSASKTPVTPQRHAASITPLFYKKRREFYETHCWYCGTLLLRFPGLAQIKKLHPAIRHSLGTKDHLIPVTRGGKGLGALNKVPACMLCNQKKGGRTLDEYRLHTFPEGGGLFWAEQHEAEYVEREKRFAARRSLIQQSPDNPAASGSRPDSQ